MGTSYFSVRRLEVCFLDKVGSGSDVDLDYGRLSFTLLQYKRDERAL